MIRGLSQAGILRASAAEMDALATNILLVATFWLNYGAARGDQDEAKSIRQGIVQMMMLIFMFFPCPCFDAVSACTATTAPELTCSDANLPATAAFRTSGTAAPSTESHATAYASREKFRS